jgi:hypothetical protein
MSVVFSGVTIPFAESEVGDLPTRDKVVEFPGDDGCEVLPMGRGVREIVVRGISTNESPSRSTIEGLADDKRHSLSIEGESYGNCRLIGVAWGKKINTLPDGFKRHFVLRFRQEVPD